MPLSRSLSALFVLALVVASTAFGQQNDMAGFSPTFLDESVSPCQDFYQYACGGWMKTHPIPPDYSAWDRYYQLEDQNQAQVRQILENAAADPKVSGDEKRIGEYYSACMDEAAIEKQGLDPLANELRRIASMRDLRSLAQELAHLHSIGVNAAFQFYSDQDARDATQVIAEIDEGGIALPDRDDYLGTEARTKERQEKYRQHVAAMFRLAGESEAEAAADTQHVWNIESALAQAWMTRLQRRDPDLRYHKLAEPEVVGLAPSFPWNEYFGAAGTPRVMSVNVANPDFLKALETLLHSQDIKAWRAYFKWELLNDAAPLLPAAFAEEDFAFNRKYLRGAAAMPPRWNRCAALVNRDLGEAIGRIYVEKYFPADRKQRMLKLVGQIEDAMATNIQSLDWMTPATRQRALEKLHKVRAKIGYPDKWRDYSRLVVSRDDALGNAFRGRQFDFRYQLSKIGRPVDRDEWFDPPQVVDGYHTSSLNEIVFTAGILQPPFMDDSLGDAVILGEVGRMIGHELTHGFDDQGRKFDGDGNLRDWWTPEDARAYEQRAACVADEYSKFVAVDDIHVDGKLTLGENIADNGGLRMAYNALHRLPEEKDAGGFSEDQRFFLAFGQSQCADVRPATERVRTTTDPHAPARARVNGSVRNMPEFEKAFHCKAGDPMAPADRCRIW
jgi:endothelin-converting enzyme/putative endopeptidase